MPEPTDYEFDVFLSHSSKDSSVARDIAERLRKDGLRVWFDEWQNRAGGVWEEEIERGLERSRVLVLCISASALTSEWSRLEAGTFRFRDPLNKERHFIPLRLDETDIKGSLAQFRCIDWLRKDRDNAYATLLEVCRPIPIKLTDRTQTEPVQISEKVTNLDYRSEIRTWAFSEDGASVLTGAAGGAIRLWDLETGRCLQVFVGHSETVWSVVWSADQRFALSGARDRTIHLWDLGRGHVLSQLTGHVGDVRCLSWARNQGLVLSGADDNTIRLWDIKGQRCLRVFEGHTGGVWSVDWSPDEKSFISASLDKTVRLWDLETGQCLRVFEGHTQSVWGVAWSPDQQRILSGGSHDKTLRLWDVETGRCLRILEGHTIMVSCIEWRYHSRYALSGGGDGTIRLWDVESGVCIRVLEGHKTRIASLMWSADRRRLFSGDVNGGAYVWDLSDLAIETTPQEAAPSLSPYTSDQVQYTNAKVLIVGESGVGKTGLTERLAHDTFTPSYSTSGSWSTQWQMKDMPVEPGWEREVWLWDFGGQADQRLIHQLYVDRAALILLVFNSDRETVVTGLREWQQALSRCIPDRTKTYLVAARIDVGFRFDRQRVRLFAEQNGFRYFETSAYDGTGCIELRHAVQTDIPWEKLERRTSPKTWKLLKDEILKLRDEGHVIFTFKEMREVLRHRLALLTKFSDTDLETVISLLDGPGVVKELSFGTFVLLRPEWMNAYAQAVIRTLRMETNIGCLPVQSIALGNLIFQSKQLGGEIIEEKRLEARDERTVLQAMEQMLLDRKLCLRQEGNLVFPSYCGVERPIGPIPPKYFVSYAFSGFLDDIYATLVVKLVYCGAFKLRELWRDAADFETLAERRAIGIKLLRDEEGRGILLVHSGKGIPVQEQVIFANYIHEHLIERATEPQRLRFHVCPYCDTSVKDSEEAMRRLEEFGERAGIVCQHCEKRIPLWDALEIRFASETVKSRVAFLQSQERIELDVRRKGKLLALEVGARITSADQKCFEVPGTEDEGIDMEVEFTDASGRGTGKRLFLQLKAGSSHLYRRKRDGAEIFKIKKQAWVKYWLKQDYPVLLVIGTFPDSSDGLSGSKDRFADIRWMEVGEPLRRQSDNGRKPVKQIVFEGERLDIMSVRRWRDRALQAGI